MHDVATPQSDSFAAVARCANASDSRKAVALRCCNVVQKARSYNLLIFRMKNRKMNFDFGPNFSGFFVRLLLTNERASDWNISGAYTIGSKEDLESVFKKIPYEHTSDLHC